MKKTFIFMYIAMMIVFMSSCSSASDNNLTYSFDSMENYTGFVNIPEDYTVEQAEKDGCYIRLNANDSANELVWSKFIEDSSKGVDSSIRIMSIYDEDTLYSDLYYRDGSYQLFDSSSEDMKVEKFKYLLDLQGRMSNAVRNSHFVVLTDDEELTFENVIRRMISSSMDVINSISSYRIVFFKS